MITYLQILCNICPLMFVTVLQCFCFRLDLGMLLQKPTSTDHETSSSQQQSQFMSQFTKHATEMLKNDLRIGTNSASHTPVPAAGPALSQQPPSQPVPNNKSQCAHTALKPKPQKSKLPPPSKVFLILIKVVYLVIYSLTSWLVAIFTNYTIRLL